MIELEAELFNSIQRQPRVVRLPIIDIDGGMQFVCNSMRTIMHKIEWLADLCLYPPEPAPLHHFTTPSSPPVTKAPVLPIAGGLGLQETAHTLSVS